MMNRLLAEIEAHALELAGPTVGGEKARAIAEELGGFYVLFHAELFGHIEEEERDVYPALKRLLADDYRDTMEVLYREHRLLSDVLTRLGFVLGRALRAECIMCFSEEIIALTHELLDLFKEHSRNEYQVFSWAGIEESF